MSRTWLYKAMLSSQEPISSLALKLIVNLCSYEQVRPQILNIWQFHDLPLHRSQHYFLHLSLITETCILILFSASCCSETPASGRSLSEHPAPLHWLLLCPKWHLSTHQGCTPQISCYATCLHTIRSVFLAQEGCVSQKQSYQKESIHLLIWQGKMSIDSRAKDFAAAFLCLTYLYHFCSSYTWNWLHTQTPGAV